MWTLHFDTTDDGLHFFFQIKSFDATSLNLISDVEKQTINTLTYF